MIAVILSSERVTSELSIDFGNISSSEIPIANQPLINFQCKSLNKFCNNIYVTRNKDFVKKEYSTEEYIDLHIEENLSLLDLILFILNKFNGKDILILYGDTLIEYPKDHNYANSTIFLTKDIKIKYPNWLEINEGLFFSGSFYFNEETVSSLINKKYLDISELLGSINNLDHYVLSKGKWFDFGHFHTYFNTKKSFLESRVFNNISITKNGFLRKSSKNIGKMIYEYNWLNQAEKLFPSLVPRVRNLNYIGNNCFYEVEYFNTPTLSDIFVFGNIDDYSKKEIISNLVRKLKGFQKIKFSGDVSSKNFLSEKLLDRKQDILNLNSSHIEIKKIEELISENVDYFSLKEFEFIFMHGDYCFSNILYNRRTDEIKLIDPRGFIYIEEGFSIYGPNVYDYFKLGHSYIALYENIIAGSNPSDFDMEKMNDRLVFFCKLTEMSRELILYGMINLFLSMIPLHSDNLSRQNHFMNLSFKLRNLL